MISLTTLILICSILFILLIVVTQFGIWLKYDDGELCNWVQKGAEPNYFDWDAVNNVIDAQFHQEPVWNAWLYSLGVTLTQSSSWWAKFKFTTPANYNVDVGTAKPTFIVGLFNAGGGLYNQNTLIMAFNPFAVSPPDWWDMAIYEDDSTMHSTGQSTYNLANSTEFYIIIIHDAGTDTLTGKVYTASDDTLRMTRTLTTTGWSFNFTDIGLSNFNSSGSVGYYLNPFEFDYIKINGGTTEDAGTIYVNTYGSNLSKVIEKGAEENYFSWDADNDYITSQFDREDVWNAWLYKLNQLIQQDKSFWSKISFTTPSDFSVSAGTPSARPGLFNNSAGTNETNSFQIELYPQGGDFAGYVKEDDGTSHTNTDTYTFVASTNYYVIIKHDAATDTATYELYTASDDTLRANASLTTTGWTFNIDMIGLSSVKSAGNNGRYSNNWTITGIQINTGITEITPGSQTRTGRLALMA